MNKIDEAGLEKGSYEFKYCFSVESKFGFVLVSLLCLGCFISEFINSFSIPGVGFSFDLFILSLPLLISLLIIYCQYKPSSFAIHEDYIEGPGSFFSPFKNARIRFCEIESLEIGKDRYQTTLFIRSNKEKISISFSFLNDIEQDHVIQALTIKLNHLEKTAPVLVELNGRILIKRIRREVALASTVLILYGLGTMMILSAFIKYHDRQPSNPMFISISIILGIGLAVFFNRRFTFKGETSRRTSTGIFFVLSIMSLYSTLSFINQVSDNSAINRKIASVLIDTETSKRRDDKCYYVNDELIKDEESMKICSKENSALNETSIVEIHYKKGNLGEVWVASLQIIDKTGDKHVKFSK